MIATNLALLFALGDAIDAATLAELKEEVSITESEKSDSGDAHDRTRALPLLVSCGDYRNKRPGIGGQAKSLVLGHPGED